MSCNKRKLDVKDHVESDSPKRACSSGGSIGSPSTDSATCSSLLKETKRKYSDEEQQRILAILENEFNKELKAKEEEVIEIQERIQRAQQVLQYVCYAVVSDFYSREKTISSVVSTRQRRIHPAVKKLLSGKAPVGLTDHSSHITVTADASTSESNPQSPSQEADLKSKDRIINNLSISVDSTEKKVPRYIPPKPKSKINHTVPSEPIRGGKNKVKTLLLVGNVSKWIPPDSREDAVTHKWMVYVRGPKEAPDISSFVSKVRFFLHPSYRPNDVVQVVCPPFQLSRRGWGEFPVRVQIHFRNSLNKPVDIIHNLKLDRTYSGLQTLGAETVAEVWIQRDDLHEEIRLFSPDPLSSENSSNPPEQSEDARIKCQNAVERTPKSIVIKEEPRSPTSNLTPTNAADEFPDSVFPCKAEPEEFENTCVSSSEFGTETCTPSNDCHILKDNMKEMNNVEKHNTVLVKHSTKTDDGGVSVYNKQTAASSALSTIEEASVRGKSIITGQDASNNVCTPANESKPSVPSSVATRLVKCVDSKGMVRLVKLSTEVLDKLMKSSTASIGKQVVASQPSLTTTSGKIFSTNTVTAHSSSSINHFVAEHAVPQLNLCPSKPPLPLLGNTLSVVRPVVRFVKPIVNTRSGTMLVGAPHPRTEISVQTPKVTRFTAPSNGDRPVLVLKDGKLILMKNLANPIANSEVNQVKAIPVSSSPVTIPSAGIRVKFQGANSTEAEPSSVLPLCNLPSTATNTVPSGSLASTAELSVNGVPLLKQPTVKHAPSLLSSSPRSVISNPPSQLSILKPQLGSENVMQMKKSGNSVTLVPKTSSNLNKTSAVSPSRSVIKPGMSLLKTGVSLLKTNVAVSSTTACNVSNRPSSSVVMPSPSSSVLKRVILGRASGPSTITTTSHRTQLYQDQLLQAISLCPRGGVEAVWRAVRWMIRFFPLINNEAHLSEFKILHPYCASSLQLFHSWNVGKQRACEWLRAKSVRESLLRAGWEAESVWTTKEIVIWARLHAYTPGLGVDEKEQNTLSDSQVQNSKKLDPFSVCLYNEALEAKKWLEDQENIVVSRNMDSIDSNNLDLEEEIDIINCDTPPSKVNKNEDTSEAGKESLEIPVEPTVQVWAQFVSDTLSTCGFKNLALEETSPGVLYPAAQRMIVQAVQSLVEDLTRRAFANAWGDNISKQPSYIDVKDVCGAILQRPELDIFTCSGLGLHCTDLEDEDDKN